MGVLETSTLMLGQGPYLTGFRGLRITKLATRRLAGARAAPSCGSPTSNGCDPLSGNYDAVIEESHPPG